MPKPIRTGSKAATIDPLDRFLLENGSAETLDDSSEIAWAFHGPAITEAWAKKHPGTRPAAWWTIDAPGPRNVVFAPPIPPDNDQRQRGGDIYVNDGTGKGMRLWLEPEAEYLRRHGLLFPGEAEAIHQRADD
jgi:hypothetical protein